MSIRIVLWTLCMAVAGFLLVGSTPSITSVTILRVVTGAATGMALGSCSLTEPSPDTAKFEARAAVAQALRAFTEKA